MATPSFTHANQNGVRTVAISGSQKLPSNKTAPPATSDIKTLNGNAVISINGGLYEPLDIATALDKI